MAELTSSKQSFNTPLQEIIEYPESGILSKVIVKDQNCQHTLFCLGEGSDLEEHTSTRNATITVIEGNGQLTLEGRDITLQPGVFVFMPANAPHALKATSNLAFLLTLSEPSQ